MINQEQSREFTRCTKLAQFLNDHNTVYADFAPFAEEVTAFISNMAEFVDLIPDKNITTTGITEDKTALKEKVAAALGIICGKTYSYALKQNNEALAAQVNTTAYKIFRIKDSDLQGFTANIVEVITPLLTDTEYIKYGVTAATLDAVTQTVNDFTALIGKADVTGSTGTVANTAIDKVIDKLRENIKHFDLLVDEFSETNSDFVNGYHINSEVQNTGIRHSGIEGYVRTKTGDAITGATVQLANTTKSAVTDLRGYYHIDRARPDDYMVACSAAGYTAQSKLYHISKGRTDEMDWEMEAV
jgi:hypothetical protein